jgi:hypothetical protein
MQGNSVAVPASVGMRTRGRDGRWSDDNHPSEAREQGAQSMNRH